MNEEIRKIAVLLIGWLGMLTVSVQSKDYTSGLSLGFNQPSRHDGLLLYPILRLGLGGGLLSEG